MKKSVLISVILAASVTVFAQNGQKSQGAPKISMDEAKSKEPVKIEFKYVKGDHYKIHSEVNEIVYVNRRLDHTAQIINRVTAEVTHVDENGNGLHYGTFMTTENSVGAISGSTFEFGEEYESLFTRSPQGVYTIDDGYFMPVVRDEPIFPNKEIVPGETWQAEGHEAHDLRETFHVEKPYKVPFTAYYKFLGIEKDTGLAVITVNYTMEMETPVPPDALYSYEDFPVGMTGFSSQYIFFDLEKGQISHYSEEFHIIMNTMYGNTFEFKGNANAVVTDFVRTSTEDNLKQVQQQVEELGLENVTVKQSDRGLTLSIENIQFKADSAELLESEKEKLRHIGEILNQWPQNDILVTGHTALAGTAKVREILSLQRAQAVADYLIQLKVREPGHIFTKGMGARQPIAPNTNEKGKAKNRRVEITIMDN